MQINVYEMIEDDKFFIGSYPDNFSKGRWFTVEPSVDVVHHASHLLVLRSPQCAH